jgi:integrase
MAEKISTTHTLLANELVVYRRERSTIWQCRYKVAGAWQRASTKERDFAKAKVRAKRLMIEAEIRKEQNLPVITRKFRDVAKLAIERLELAQASGNGKVIYKDYIRVIKDVCVPYLGKRNITAIDYAVLSDFDVWRTAQMGKAPSKSTLMTQNAALNRVFEEALIRGFLTHANKPVLTAKGKDSKRRAAFDMNEIRAVFGNFDAWIDRAKNDVSKEWRLLLCDYVHALLDTGARPGTELLNLKWKQVKFAIKPVVTKQLEVDEEGEHIETLNLNSSCELTVTEKNGTRTMVGMERTVKALQRIAKRNYGKSGTVLEPLRDIAIATNDDYVFRTKSKAAPTSFQKLFEGYLEEHSLLVDPITEQKRVFYSLRHTYATLALTNDKVPIHTLAKQMGTSVLMIESHYSHLKAVQAIEQLRGEETRRLIEAGGVVDEIYKAKPKRARNKASTKI